MPEERAGWHPEAAARGPGKWPKASCQLLHSGEKPPLGLLFRDESQMPPPQQQLRPVASHLTNAVTVREAENAFRLVEGDVLLNLHHILVEAGACPAKTESSAPSECLPGGLPLRAKRQLVKPSG